jgi:cytochrome c nitrite reductase small subunit
VKRSTTWMVMGVAAVVLAVPGFMLWDYHKQPQFCGTCHIMDSYVEAYHESDFLVRAHAEEDVGCLDCHIPTIQEQVNELIVFVSGDFEDPLQMRRFPDEFCLQCHEHGSYEQIIERTADYMIDGELRNPHDPHPDVDASLVDDFACSECHRVHRASPSINHCYSCHHEYVFEGCGGPDCH